MPSLLASLLLACILAGPGALAGEALAQDSEAASKRPAARPGRTGLPLPRFVSLRADVVNMRAGPGMRYPIEWVYRRSGLPVEVIDEFEAWRRIRDWEGTVGWVHRSMLQARRTLQVTGEPRLLRAEPGDEMEAVARLEVGALGDVERCEELWCRVEIGGFEGWLKRHEFHGVYPREAFD